MTKTIFKSASTSYEAPMCECLALGYEGVLCESFFGEGGEPGEELHEGGLFEF